MSKIIGGWEISLEAGLRTDAAAYDVSVYDDPATGYDAGGGQLQWVRLDCQLTRVSCSRGMRASAMPGAFAEAGRLLADFHDPDRVLDPTFGAFELYLAPGTPVRLVARKLDELAVMWTGTADRWEHELLDGSGSLDAADEVARLAAIPVAGESRPVEDSGARIAGLLALAPDPPIIEPSGAGSSLVDVVLSGDLWQLVGEITASDGSWLWVTAEGVVRWQGGGAPPVVDPVVLLDCPDDDVLWDAIYTRLPVTSDEQLIVNEISAQRLYPAGQTPPAARRYADDASRQAYDPHSLTNTRLQLTTDQEIDEWASEVLRVHSRPLAGPTGVELTVDERLPWAERTMDAVTALEVGVWVEIHLTTRGEPQQSWRALVAAIRHDVRPTQWVCSLQLERVEELATGGYDAPMSQYDVTEYATSPARRMVYA